ncbi:MAG: hypothetical protein B7Z20_12975 [Sphingobium sp. 32-64-5]|nr:MAG: hypothetical protein B7Z20_12975 [Sphingobium sp. 32-64-5]
MSDNDGKVAAEQGSRPSRSSTKADAGISLATETASDTPQPVTKGDANLGNALRTIYRQTVEEAIPDEMLDLLKRLG